MHAIKAILILRKDSLGIHMPYPIISVIVPVYKVEPYIDRCIDSIVNQTYRNLEIILVDDGSPDRCPEICESWAEKDSRIKVIHKENGGLSAARNCGIECCHGDYIGFVDSDDWIEPDMYEKLYNTIVKYNVPLAMGGRFDIYENCLTDKKRTTYGNEKVISAQQLLPKMLLGDGCDSVAWDKLYHKSLWKEIRFPDGEIFEDIAIMYKLIIKANKIAICDDPLYNYYHRSGSITESSFNPAYLAYPKHTRKMLEEIAVMHPDLERYAIYSHIRALRTVLFKLSFAEKSIFEKYKDVYYSHMRELRSCKHFWKKNKEWYTLKSRLVLFIYTHPPLYFLLRWKLRSQNCLYEEK